MPPNAESVFYDAVLLLCGAMAVFNLARYKARGNSAFYLGGAFLALALMVYAYSKHYSMIGVVVGGLLVFGLLAADMVFRVGNQPGRKP